MELKRALLSVIAVACILCVCAQASFAVCGCSKAAACASPDRGNAPAGPCDDTAWTKLGRGLANSISFPLELPSQISKAYRCDGPFAAFTYGIIKGIGMTAFRAVVGVYEIVSFPIPCPEGYQPILTDPEYFFQDQVC